MSGSNEQQQPPGLDELYKRIEAQLVAAASGQQQLQLPSLPAPQAQTQYSNDPSQGPDLLARIGLALGGGSLPGAPAELRQQLGKQALLNFGIGLMSAGRFASPGEVLAGGLRGAQGGLLGREAALAGQQEYALNAQTKMAELAGQQQKNRTEALTALVPLLQLQGRMGLPPLFGPGSGAGGPGGGPGAGEDIYSLPKDEFLAAVAKRESGGDPTALNYVAKADPTAYARGATASGKYQMVNSTWLTAAKGAGIDTAKYPTAMSAPEALQDKAASWLYDNQGTAPWNPSKFGAAWVPTPTGQFILAHTAPGAAPPGGPPAASPPSDGKLPAPPSKPTPGSAVGPFGVGAFAPPTTTVAAPPDTTANAPNTGTALPVPTPAMTAALAEAKRTGKPAVIEGSGGATVGPDGKFSGNVTTGRRADADAILQGVQTAQTTLPPADTVTTAGPGAGGGGTPPAAQPAPDSAFGGGAFATAPPRFVGPVTAPAAPAQPPAQPAQPPAQPAQPPAQPAQPPVHAPDLTARNDDGSFVVPNDKLSLPDYQQRFRHVPTAEELTQRGLVIPGNEAEAQAAARGVQEAETAAAAAQRAANLAMQPGYNQSFGTVADLLKANTEAQAKAQAAREKYAEMLQDTTKTNAAALQKYYEKQDTDLAANYKAEVLDPRNTERQQRQASDLKIHEGLVAAGTADDQKVLQGIDATTESAHDTLATIDMAKRLSLAAGNKSALAVVSPGLATMLQRSGLLSQEESNKLDAQSALDGVLSKMAGTMRTGMGFSRMTNMDLQFLQNMVGTSNIPESRRNAMFAFMQTALERQYQYGALVREYYGGGPNAGGMTLAKAREAADEKLGHIVQTVPDGLSPDKGDLFVQQHVSPGTFYVRDGQLRIRGQ